MKAALPLCLITLLLAAAPADAGTMTRACEREITTVLKGREEALTRLRGLNDLPQEAKCAAIARQGEFERTSRAVFARCLTGKDREQYVSDSDEMIETVRQAYTRVCQAKS